MHGDELLEHLALLVPYSFLSWSLTLETAASESAFLSEASSAASYATGANLLTRAKPSAAGERRRRAGRRAPRCAPDDRVARPASRSACPPTDLALEHGHALAHALSRWRLGASALAEVAGGVANSRRRSALAMWPSVVFAGRSGCSARAAAADPRAMLPLTPQVVGKAGTWQGESQHETQTKWPRWHWCTWPPGRSKHTQHTALLVLLYFSGPCQTLGDSELTPRAADFTA